jgi:hypothetical protein
MREETMSIMERFRIPKEDGKRVDPVEFLVERGGALIDDLYRDPETRMLWMDLTIVAQRGDSRSRALAAEIIDSVLDSLLPEIGDAVTERSPETRSMDSRDRLLCLTHVFDGFVINLGLSLRPDVAKRYWETMVRMLLDERCNHETR